MATLEIGRFDISRWNEKQKKEIKFTLYSPSTNNKSIEKLLLKRREDTDVNIEYLFGIPEYPNYYTEKSGKPSSYYMANVVITFYSKRDNPPKAYFWMFVDTAITYPEVIENMIQRFFEYDTTVRIFKNSISEDADDSAL